tara:strand:- start:321 stop:500 length:180 start_codon:yes stop_codon:yes gene_type:complete
MDFLLAQIDQLTKDKQTLIRQNQELRKELIDEKIKNRLLGAKNEILFDQNSEKYFNSKK